jgi:hypothetical protein
MVHRVDSHARIILWSIFAVTIIEISLKEGEEEVLMRIIKTKWNFSRLRLMQDEGISSPTRLNPRTATPTNNLSSG